MFEKIKIVFLGTPEFSCPFLETLANDSRFEVLAVITQEDKPFGRKKVLTPTPIKQSAIKLNLPVFQPIKLNKEVSLLDNLEKMSIDFLVVVAYGQILNQRVLNIPKIQSINVHGSILPKYRGASPIESAILNGETQTGLSVMAMALQMDAGPVYQNIEITINPYENAHNLRKRLSLLGAQQLPEILLQIKTVELTPKPQNESEATYCQKISKENGLIDTTLLSAQQIYYRFRAYFGWPGIYLIWQGKIIKLLDIAITTDHSLVPGQFKTENNHLFLGCQSGTIEILELQIEGKTAQKTTVFLNGNRSLFS